MVMETTWQLREGWRRGSRRRNVTGKLDVGQGTRGGIEDTEKMVGKGRGGGETADYENTNPRGGRNTGRKNRRNRILKCMTLNAQSIINKFSEFKLIIRDQKPHIISITESWGQDWHPDSLFALDGYTLYRNDRQHEVEEHYYISATPLNKECVGH